MLIGFASTGGGCAHYRAELPARMVAATGLDTCWTDHDLMFGSEGGMGFDVTGVNFSPSCSGRIVFDHDDARGVDVVCPDVIVLAAGWVRAHPDVLAAASRNGQRIVTDCDDWPWLPPENPHAIEIGTVWQWNAGEAKLASMRSADACTVSTDYMMRLCDSREVVASVCRNMIDPTRYANARLSNTYKVRGPFRGPLVIGYRGMLAGFHDGDVETLRGCLPTENVRYVHVGADPRGKTFAEVAGVDPALVDNRPACEFADYSTGRDLVGVDVAVIPFASRPFSQAKSNIAGLEWTAAGVPWVASDQLEYTRLDRPACAHKPREWSKILGAHRSADYRAAVLDRQTVAARAYDYRNAGDTAGGWRPMLDRLVPMIAKELKGA